MHRTESDNKITVGGKNQFTDGPPGTTLNAVDKNTIQEEIAYVIETNGLSLKTVSTETNQQLYAAIAAQIVASAPDTLKAVDFSTKNLVINVQSNTTVDADADEIAYIDSSNTLTFESDFNVTFDITTDLMAGTSEKASTWYQMWADSAGVTLLVPDLASTTDGTSANKLIDSGATFSTDLVQIGDIVYNLTDFTQTTVTAIDSGTQLSVADDIFISGEEYKVRMLSPTGLGASRARIGEAYNNSSSNLDDSHYTHPPPPRQYVGSVTGTGVDFQITGTSSFTTVRSIITMRQTEEVNGVTPVWRAYLNITGSTSSVTAVTISIVGIVFESTAGNESTLAIGHGKNATYMETVPASAGDLYGDSAGADAAWRISGELECAKKPTWGI